MDITFINGVNHSVESIHIVFIHDNQMQKYQRVQCKFQIHHCLRCKLTLYVTKLPRFFSLLKQNNLTFEDKRGVVVNKALQVVRGM